MPIERTLVIVKPDAVLQGREKEILERYAQAGLVVLEYFYVNLPPEQAQTFYAEHKDRPFFAGLTISMSHWDCVIALVEGENAIAKVRELNGPTKDAPTGTIRGDFPSAGGPFNVVHASDGPESAKREIGLFFP